MDNTFHNVLQYFALFKILGASKFIFASRVLSVWRQSVKKDIWNVGKFSESDFLTFKMAKKENNEGLLWMKEHLDAAIYSNVSFSTGGIVGHVEIFGCVQMSDYVWFKGPKGFLLRRPLVLDFHPCPGRLGFFDVEVQF